MMQHDVSEDAKLDDELRALERAIAAPLRPLDVEETREVAQLQQVQQVLGVAEPARRTRAAGPGPWGLAAAGAWVASTLGAGALYVGVEGLALLHPAVFAAAFAVAAGPAALIAFASAAARESNRVRNETAELAELAREALAPVERSEARARRMGLTVRSEIGAIETVVQKALDRFGELEAAAARNAVAFDNAVSCAHDGALILRETMQQERAAFEGMSLELREQSEFLAGNVGRQIRMMREATRLLRNEYESADQTLQAQLSSVTTSAHMMAERTAALGEAAEATKAAAARLDVTAVGALDALAQATNLTDAARQAAESAAHAANATASSVRETTQRAVTDARKVAQLIRAETQAMEESATSTVAKLREAAQEARRASEEAQAAADKQVVAIQRRLSGMGANVRSAAPVVHPIAANDDVQYTQNVRQVANGAAYEERPTPTMFSGVASMSQFMPVDAPPASYEKPRSATDRALSILAQAGVQIDTVFEAADLDYIGSRARHGAQARRTAVTAVAGQAVENIRALMARDPSTRSAIAAFRDKPELTAVDAGKSNLVAYLLVDAAAG